MVYSWIIHWQLVRFSQYEKWNKAVCKIKVLHITKKKREMRKNAKASFLFDFSYQV